MGNMLVDLGNMGNMVKVKPYIYLHYAPEGRENAVDSGGGMWYTIGAGRVVSSITGPHRKRARQDKR